VGAEAYFDVQLRFAGHYARIAKTSLSEAVAVCTNLRRRFGLWGAAGEAPWTRFLNGIVPGMPHEELLRRTCEFNLACDPPSTPRHPFGCFSYEVSSGAVLRIHFQDPHPASAEGPLARSRMPERLAELKAMFAHVRGDHPEVTSIRGVSWLYHLDAYKRLFPPAYGASAALPTFPLHLNGSSSWGQVLDHRQEVKADMRAQLTASFPHMTMDAPWRIFPLPALVATAPVDLFAHWY
jgi:hypothetical protein